MKFKGKIQSKPRRFFPYKDKDKLVLRKFVSLSLSLINSSFRDIVVSNAPDKRRMLRGERGFKRSFNTNETLKSSNRTLLTRGNVKRCETRENGKKHPYSVPRWNDFVWVIKMQSWPREKFWFRKKWRDTRFSKVSSLSDGNGLSWPPIEASLLSLIKKKVKYDLKCESHEVVVDSFETCYDSNTS